MGEESKRCTGNGGGVGSIEAAGLGAGAGLGTDTETDTGVTTGVEGREFAVVETERRVIGWEAGVDVVLLVAVPETAANVDLVAGTFFVAGTGFSFMVVTGTILGGVGEFGGSGVSGGARPLQTRHLQFSGFLLGSVAIQTKWGWKSAADL